MKISNKAEYVAAAERANALSDAPEGSPAGRELAELVAALRGWDAAHRKERGREDNPEPASNTSPDDLPVAGLPGNLGKLRQDG
jgi:hypothetical protein